MIVFFRLIYRDIPIDVSRLPTHRNKWIFCGYTRLMTSYVNKNVFGLYYFFFATETIHSLANRQNLITFIVYFRAILYNHSIYQFYWVLARNCWFKSHIKPSHVMISYHIWLNANYIHLSNHQQPSNNKRRLALNWENLSPSPIPLWTCLREESVITQWNANDISFFFWLNFIIYNIL